MVLIGISLFKIIHSWSFISNAHYMLVKKTVNIFPGRELIIEMLLYQPSYLNALQTMCPHVLRYLATAVVINKSSRRQSMKVCFTFNFMHIKVFRPSVIRFGMPPMDVFFLIEKTVGFNRNLLFILEKHWLVT